jgi:xanthine/uracil permease
LLLLQLNVDILNTLIKNQKDAIRYQTLFAGVVLFLGLFLIVVSNFFTKSPSANDTIKLILSIGGGCISTISAFPINQIINRKEKIRTYEIFKKKIPDMTKVELQKVEELIWKSLEKIM